MMNVFLYGRVLFVAFAALGLAAQGALAQSWPTRPVRIIVPFEPGGALISRVVCSARNLQKASAKRSS